MSDVELCYMSASELRHEFSRRSLSPVEVARAVLNRIDSINPKLNAFVTVTPERAMKDALRAEEAYATGSGVPYLAGIPYSLKDLTPTKGIRTTKGSRLWRDWVPDFDTPIVERLTRAGGVLLGKTNTPELGWKGESTNPLVGSTLNPWNLRAHLVVRVAARRRQSPPDLARWRKGRTAQGRSAFPRPLPESSGSRRPSGWCPITHQVRSRL